MLVSVDNQVTAPAPLTLRRRRSTGVRPDRGPGRRQSAVHPRPGQGAGPWSGWPSPHPARRGRRGQGLLVRGNRAHLRRRGIKAVIPEEKDQAANRKKKGSRGGRPVRHDAELYTERNTVERLINNLRSWRGIATRYDKAPDSYLAGLHLRASMIWINDLARTAQ